MIKMYCDICKKEIKDNNYILQNIFCYFEMENTDINGESIYCKKCFEKMKPEKYLNKGGVNK